MKKKKLITLIIIGVLALGFVSYKFISSGYFSIDHEGINKIYDDVTFEKVVDGDTAYFTINGKSTKCRFLAVDTPELKTDEPYAQEAKQYSEDALKNAKKIRLATDSNSDEYDKYDRLLVWVYVDEELLQNDLIKEGLAEVKYIYGDYKYVDELYKLQDVAKSQGIGIWSIDE